MTRTARFESMAQTTLITSQNLAVADVNPEEDDPVESGEGDGEVKVET